MMTIVEKILALYPDITIQDFSPVFGCIEVRNDSDGRGDYIASWEHPTLPRPTDAQLEGAA